MPLEMGARHGLGAGASGGQGPVRRLGLRGSTHLKIKIGRLFGAES